MNREQLKQLEKDLWAAADNLRTNSDLKASEYSMPLLDLSFFKFAEDKYLLASRCCLSLSACEASYDFFEGMSDSVVRIAESTKERMCHDSLI